MKKIYKKLLFDKLEVNKGMIVENFLIAKSKISSRHNISPIEVKSSKNYTLTSLRKFKNKYGEQLHIPYVLHTGDFKEDDGITFLPLYMTPPL